MKKSAAVTAHATVETEKQPRGSMPPRKNTLERKNAEWSVTHKMRLPHKIGLPLGSGGGGDDTGSS